MMRFLTSICLAIAGLVSASCVATRPVHYYTIDPASPPANLGKPDGLILLVGDISTPAALQDGRIRYRIGSNEAGAYEYPSLDGAAWFDGPQFSAARVAGLW
jgi:hypothetical protein